MRKTISEFADVELITTKLRAYLNRLLTDDEIASHPQFNEEGLRKIARHLGVDVSQVPALVDHVANTISDEDDSDDAEPMNEDSGPNFTWEEDSLGNLTVRCARSGEEKKLDVKAAARLLQMLDGTDGTEQEILGRVMRESVEIAPKELSDEEFIMHDMPYNFPWKLDGKMGFGVARCKGHGSTFSVDVTHVMDKNGDEIEPDHEMMIRLKKIAEEFIDDA